MKNRPDGRHAAARRTVAPPHVLANPGGRTMYRRRYTRFGGPSSDLTDRMQRAYTRTAQFEKPVRVGSAVTFTNVRYKHLGLPL